jgi:cellulose synthase/poly-beta-1,6-N-acetylglucosamine synthase-like glycosyltransferase
MTLVETVLLVVYFSVLMVLSMYGSHRYFMAYLYYRHKFKMPWPKGKLTELPPVTIQLPIFNEMYVVERLIGAVCAIDYPKDRLEIQVIDDSNDETREIAARCVEKFRQQGLDVRYINRGTRIGYKAGALAHGLKSAKGQFVAVFDADFIPQPDFLKRTMAHFADSEVGMVQVRWGHLNRGFSALTQAQSILLDGHFVIEHTARNRSGRFFNFNGTAGVWRRTCIESAGGWQHDTLTEDLDLSYRAQLNGWKFVFLPDVVSPAEVPVDMNAFKSQQHRWAKGSIQTARKLLGVIFTSRLPWKVKQEAFFHLTANMAYPLMVVLTILMPIAVVVRFRHGWYGVLLLDLPFFVLATLSVCAFYVVSQREIGDGRRAFKYLPVLMALGIGLSVNNAHAVIEALVNEPGDFARTPKLGVTHPSDPWKHKKYRARVNWLPLVELALGLYLSAAIVFVVQRGIWFSLPFLILFQAGFLYVGLMSALEARFRSASLKPAADAA